MNNGLAISKCHPDVGNWVEVLWRPGSDHPLAYAVDAVWHREGTTRCETYSRLPNGLLEIVAILEGGCARQHPTVVDLFPPLFFAGQHLSPEVLLAPRGRFRTVGIGLHPEGAFALCPHSAEELTDNILPVERLLAGDAHQYLDSLHEMRDPIRTVTWIVDWLKANLLPQQEKRALPPTLRHGIRRLIDTSGTIAISDLVSETGLAESTLCRHFRQMVGVTPKRFGRLHRFRRTLDLLRNADIDLVQVALETDFYDQAHMTHEVRILSGLTPRECRSAIDHPAAPYRVFRLPEGHGSTRQSPHGWVDAQLSGSAHPTGAA